MAVCDSDETVLLAPGEGALVPVAWDRPIPADDFVCESCSGTEFENGLDAAPGICKGGEYQMMLSVQNETHEHIT